ncbi:MAG: MFS transporter [Planctomycetes bacterium]|nr:MFS transporter [Planctomycetota bacterium]
MPDVAAAAQVRRLGWLHFINDCTLDFLTPLLPSGVAVGWIGVMEGLADAVSQGLRLFSGRASDAQRRRVPWVRAGYLTNAVARPLTAVGMLAAWWWWIVACRVLDRLGKGLRSSAADALVADWTEGEQRARAYARLRWMDHGGAMLGALAAAAVAWAVPTEGLWVAVLALAPLALLVPWLAGGLQDRQLPEAPATGAGRPLGWWPRAAILRRPLLAIAAASLALRLSPLLILMHVAGWSGTAPQAAWPLWQLCLGWAALGLIQALAAAAAGALTVRVGPRRALQALWALAAADCALLAVGEGPALLLAGLLWGLIQGALEGTEKTWLAELAPAAERGLAFAALALVGAGAGLLGNAACGWVLAHGGPGVFAVLALCCLAGVLLTLGRSGDRGTA